MTRLELTARHITALELFSQELAIAEQGIDDCVRLVRLNELGVSTSTIRDLVEDGTLRWKQVASPLYGHIWIVRRGFTNNVWTAEEA